MIHALEGRKLEILGASYFIADNATLIGSVIIHNDVSIWFNAVIRGDHEPITIDEGTNIQDGVVIHTDEGIPMRVGKGVTVGHNAMLHGCNIGDNSLVGIGAVILNNAQIGENCIVGACSLVTQGLKIPDNSLVMGSPAKVVRELSEQEIQGLRESAEHYVENYKRYKRGLTQDDVYTY